MHKQVSFGYELMVVRAGSQALYAAMSLSIFEVIHNFKKTEKKKKKEEVLVREGVRGRGGAEWTGSIFDGSSKTPSPDVSFYVLPTSLASGTSH